jgi:hypothetical protein
MVGHVINLGLERRVRTLDRALASVEAKAAEVRDGLDQINEKIDNFGIDPRALELLEGLKRHFAGHDRLLGEIAHLKRLLRNSRRTDEQ